MLASLRDQNLDNSGTSHKRSALQQLKHIVDMAAGRPDFYSEGAGLFKSPLIGPSKHGYYGGKFPH